MTDRMAVDLVNGSKSVLGLDDYKSNEDLAKVVLFEGFPPPLLLFGSACCLVFMIIGIPGNLITIIALARYKKIRNATAIFIIHLHIVDLIFCLTILPIVAITFYDGSWTTGKTVCRLYPMVKYVLTGVFLLSVVAIAINRYVKCCHPLLYSRLFRRKYICIMIIGIWLFNLVLLSPTFFEILGRFSLNPEVGVCTIIPDKHDRSPKMALLIIAFVIPCLIMCFCYIRLICVVRKTTRKCQNTAIKADSSTSECMNDDVKRITLNEEGSNEEVVFQKRSRFTFKRKTTEYTLPNKKDKRLQTMIVIIMATFCVCRLPYLLTTIVFKQALLNHAVFMIGYTLMHSMNCINPIIYVLLSSEYRKAYKNLFKRDKCVGV